ncbi:MAG: hypothetical protein J6P80_04875, partial [Kiritimatiellae bacterium]|nr:hypothetical protein [Kiritimatiellia bacterium]
ELMGRAAALDMIVGRRRSETGELLFDKNYEVVILGDDGMPKELAVTDHAGSFVDYERPLADCAADYARVATERKLLVADYPAFVDAYVRGFAAGVATAQENYRARRRAFDNLFVDRPFDVNGSGAYRWACTLRRLDEADPAVLAARLRDAIGAVEC